VIDDQPFELSWLVEYLESQSLAGESAVTLRGGVERVEASEHAKYKLVIVDMEMPLGGYVGKPPKEAERAVLYDKYPGLYAAQAARNYGYSGASVLVYSVHQNTAILAEVERLNCQYMLKGRPRSLKGVIATLLAKSA
jgi:CheY-like chemotaxis protein